MSQMSFESIQNDVRLLPLTDPSKLEQNVAFLSHVVTLLSSSTISRPQLKQLLHDVGEAIEHLRLVSDSVRSEQKAHVVREQVGHADPLADLIKNVYAFARNQKFTHFRIETARTNRFRQIAKKLRPLGQGATFPGARIMASIDWQERYPISLIIDGKEYKGNFVKSLFAHDQTSYIQDWKTGTSAQGVAFHETYSFEEYMNTVVIPNLSQAQKEELKTKCSQEIDFYTREELATLAADIEPTGRIYLHAPYFLDWVHLPEGEITYRKFLEQIQKRPPINLQEKYVLPGGEKRYIYVLTTKGELYIQSKRKGSTQHSSLSGGQAVASAGQLEIDRNGRICGLFALSGHYKPTATQVLTMLEFLQRKGVDIDRINVSELPVTSFGGTTDVVERGEVKKWVASKREASIASILEHSSQYSREDLEKMPYGQLEQLCGESLQHQPRSQTVNQ